MNNYIVLFEKKLGAYYLIDLVQDIKQGKLIITLYKKWTKHEGYEATDNKLYYDILKERERALNKFNMISLKTLEKDFNWKK